MKFFVCFCAFAIVGLATAKTIPPNVNKTVAINDKDTAKFAAYCHDQPDDTIFPDPNNCQKFWSCWQGESFPWFCDDGELFNPDPDVWWCDDADNVDCEDNVEPDDNGCPPAGSDELVFLPSHYCSEYYICINGNPILRECGLGLHWNEEEEFCDNPWTAGCDPDATEPPPGSDTPSNCPPGFYGQIPHPTNCNKFIHCNDGSRSIQRCQHLFHFDANLGRCVFKRDADCNLAAMKNE